MRGIAFVVLSLAMVSSAQASSILVLGDKPSGSRSIITLGDARAKDPSIVTLGQPVSSRTASPSVVVLGEPAVSNDKVAAIPAARQPRAGGVLVIRAGVAGGASAPPVATAAQPASAAKAADSTSTAVKASNGTLRDAMTQAGNAPAMPQ
jgi:hypothetical protein